MTIAFEPTSFLASYAFQRHQQGVREMSAIRAAAHAMGLGSIALATTLQFELSFRQKDVIGEWEPAPLSEGGIVHKGTRWANGLQWSDIDPAMVLRKTHIKTGAYIEFDLKLYPTLVEEIERVPREKRIGPMVISERHRRALQAPDVHSDMAQGRRQGGCT
jgi:hypothetical protein